MCVFVMTSTKEPFANNDFKDFLKTKLELLKKIKTHIQKPLTKAVAVNATRYTKGNAIKSFGIPTSLCSGGKTKYNRVKQGYKNVIG